LISAHSAYSASTSAARNWIATEWEPSNSVRGCRTERMEYKVYLNGKFVPESEAKISVYDHGFLYGDGVFEGIRAYHGRIFRLDEHVERLFRSARAIMLPIPRSPGEMRELVLETCRRNALASGYIRVVVSRGEGDLGI